MKKLISILLVAVLVSAMFAIPVNAEYFWSEGEYELVADGNWQPYFSWGYVFEIDSVNSTSGACTAIFDNATDYAAKGPGQWTTQIVLAPVAGEEDVYEVIAAYKTTGKNAQANLDDGTIDFEDGKIVLSVQDSGTRPEKDAEGNLVFPNWEDRAASWGLMNTLRAKLTLDGNTLTVEDKPTPVISGWGADVDVMTDGYTGVGEITGYEGNNDKIYGFGNNLLVKAEYDFTVAIEEAKFDAITLYALDYANGGVMLPEAVKFVVNGASYDAVITPNENGIATIVAEFDEAVTASEIKVMVVMGASPYTFPIFNMFTEITVDEVEDEPAKPSVEDEMKEALGTAFDDAKFDLDIDAPETYKAGDDITVTVTVKNITAENGIHVIEFNLYYDNEKLLITNDLDETDYNALLCIDELPKGWENLSNVANDWTNETEEGTVVNPLNDGKINVIALTDKTAKSAAVKDDDVLVFTFTFKALEDAKGDIGLVIPHAEAEGAFNTDTGADKYEANGDYAVIADSTAEKPGDDTKPGDASNMIIFAIIALVAIMGSAVVIKTRK